jgi:hypothetical protein
MKIENKYFISLIPVNGHDLVKPLTKKLSMKGYKIICRQQELSIRTLLEKKKFLSAIQELINRIFWKIYFYLFILIKRNAKIIFAWPQIAGFELIFKAVKYNKVILYIMDCSFFCIRSYNVHPIKNNECVDCLGSIKPHKLCLPYPKKYKKLANIKYLELLKENANKFIFYSQNKLQKILLKKHFGNNINVKIVGMNIGEVKKSQKLIKTKSLCYDIVFHGNSLIAKGLLYVIKLAEHLPDQTFLIPDSKKNVQNILNIDSNFSNNLEFKEMNWENGLREAVMSAGLVINPSIWSAPIEAALIKSAASNQNVATVKSLYGYEKEIRSIKNHIRLSADIQIAANQIKIFFNK